MGEMVRPRAPADRHPPYGLNYSPGKGLLDANENHVQHLSNSYQQPDGSGGRDVVRGQWPVCRCGSGMDGLAAGVAFGLADQWTRARSAAGGRGVMDVA